MADLSVVRKTTNTYTLTFTNNGAVQNITGWTVLFTVKKNISQTDAQAVISKTYTSHTDPTHGITKVVLSPTDTDIPAGMYVYDITYIDTSTNRKTINPSNFTVIGQVTQRSS